ncbi:MAG: acyl-ACP--UDP-N-acetylglucosamine O-acyltransferase [Ignavibacteriae bacterium]|nr:acyl-ACP--UDP-N-acetylglucosamine O-acyltransferase [Ignavibacteriota bacterium]
MSTSIDPRAAVSAKAQIGDNVTIGPFAVVEDGAVIGDGTSVAPHALIATGARIAKNCIIHHGAVVGHAPQDLKYAGEPTTCEVGEGTTVREYATLHRGTGEGGKTVIGTNCFLMGYVHIAHDCIVGNNVIMSNAAMLAGHTEVEDNVIIGGVTPVHQFTRIGCHSMVGGGLRVAKDVPPYSLVGGAPLVFEGLNAVGLRRRGFSRETLEGLDKAYTMLYRAKMNVSQAIAAIEADATLMAFPEVQHMVSFIKGSKRGIVGAPRLRS